MILYYLLVALVLGLAGPVLLLAPKRRSGIGQKLGIVPNELIGRFDSKVRPVWFHAVSVGEFNAVWPLIQRFAQEHKDRQIVISTATQTGQNLARERAGNLATVIYFPLDLPWALNRWLDAIAPALVVIVETEIWPGFTHECTRRSIPLVVVNGRISPRSFRSYYRWRAFFGPVIRQFRAVVAQSEADANRYRAIAGDAVRMTVSGNLKFDGLKPIAAAETAELRESVGLRPADLAVIGGSTHEGEEAALLSALAEVRSRAESAGQDKAGGQARLILAPRHPERWDQVIAAIESRGLRVRRYSKNERLEGENDVYLLDTIGQLFRFYSLAAVAFVGGTLVPIGGHSLVEPCAYGVPVVCGPHLEKTQDSANGLKAVEALTVVADSGELADKLSEILASESVRRTLGGNGRAWLAESQGAIGKTLEILERVLATQYNDPRPESGHNDGVLTNK